MKPECFNPFILKVPLFLSKGLLEFWLCQRSFIVLVLCLDWGLSGLMISARVRVIIYSWAIYVSSKKMINIKKKKFKNENFSIYFQWQLLIIDNLNFCLNHFAIIFRTRDGSIITRVVSINFIS